MTTSFLSKDKSGDLEYIVKSTEEVLLAVSWTLQLVVKLIYKDEEWGSFLIFSAILLLLLCISKLGVTNSRTSNTVEVDVITNDHASQQMSTSDSSDLDVDEAVVKNKEKVVELVTSTPNSEVNVKENEKTSASFDSTNSSSCPVSDALTKAVKKEKKGSRSVEVEVKKTGRERKQEAVYKNVEMVTTLLEMTETGEAKSQFINPFEGEKVDFEVQKLKPAIEEVLVEEKYLSNKLTTQTIEAKAKEQVLVEKKDELNKIITHKAIESKDKDPQTNDNITPINIEKDIFMEKKTEESQKYTRHSRVDTQRTIEAKLQITKQQPDNASEDHEQIAKMENDIDPEEAPAHVKEDIDYMESVVVSPKQKSGKKSKIPMKTRKSSKLLI